MDLIPPVRAGEAPSKRPDRKGDGKDMRGFARSFARTFGFTKEPSVSLRLAAPLANIPMLLEILSDAGEPANTDPHLAQKLYQRADTYIDLIPDGDDTEL